MKRFLLFLLFPFCASAQITISGTVTERNGQPIGGANVYIKNTYDGSTSDDNGNFRFHTSESGEHTLVVSYISFETLELTKSVSEMKDLKIVLKPDVNSLNAVTISAGSFSAGDPSKTNFLKPLDIVTTASAVGDLVGALQTLPGTSMNAEDGRLFVRGGDAEESLIFIDGIRVFTPYTVSANNSPVRGRYSPFLFDGISFSTGGYSAEYGQALSGILLLNTIEDIGESRTDVSLMSLGAGLGHTQKWERNSISVNTAYIDLEPYTAIFPDKNDWHKPYRSFSGETVFRQKIGEGLLKIYQGFEATGFSFTQEDIRMPEGVYFHLKDRNVYSNISFKKSYSKGWKIFSGGSYTHARTTIDLDNLNVQKTENDFHLKLKARKRFSNSFHLNFGLEHVIQNFSESGVEGSADWRLAFNQQLTAAFIEADWVLSSRFAVQSGMRFENDFLLNRFSGSPRISTAYKVGKDAQISLAYGSFLQAPNSDALKFSNTLKNQQAQHYILNYEYTGSGKIFRAEVYRKSYSDLISLTKLANETSSLTNNGFGYAQGVDLFFRDQKSFKNTDYWISYSLIDTKRKYKDYPEEAMPSFVNTHNLSIVGEYWVNAIKSQIGLSYQFGSGRPYTDKNKPGFLQEKSKSYNNISFNMAYLMSRQKILYFAVSNVFGFKNNFGFQYATNPNPNGKFESQQLSASRDQFFFVGFFWTISSDKSSNQLKNL